MRLCIAIMSVIILGLGVGGVSTATLQSRLVDSLTFEKDAGPILAKRCGNCHGARQTRAGLDVRTLGDILEGGHKGPAIIAGDPNKSLLIQLMRKGAMPPGGGVPKSELAMLEQWIRTGAAGTRNKGGHWAFKVPVRATQPSLPGTFIGSWRTGLIDRFIGAKMAKSGLVPSPRADRRVLIRRVTYDVLGVPPTPEEIDAFVFDSRSDAWVRLVDRLLADPRYGEKWARHYLDAAGYCDSEGVLQEDLIRGNAWRYRDYVIRSLNSDKPYDQFLTEQIAGDELFDFRKAERFTPQMTEALTATGFLRTAVDATRDDFNTHQFTEYQYRMLHDTQTIVATSILGLTVQCSRCHDHKYEPITAKDYYSLQAIFTGAIRPKGKLLPTGRRQVTAAGTLEVQEANAKNAQVDADVKKLHEDRAALTLELRLRHIKTDKTVAEEDRFSLVAALQAVEASRSPIEKSIIGKYKAVVEAKPESLLSKYSDLKLKWDNINSQLARLASERITLPVIRALYDQDGNPPPTKILVRGEYEREGQLVEPGIPLILASRDHPYAVKAPYEGGTTTGRRLAFARWITRADHPLTARVAVNRIWAHHFGTGIVATPDNLGRSGAKPSHPELLDTLAVSFATGDYGPGQPKVAPWSLKGLHRAILLSDTYCQSSQGRADAQHIDPDNRLLWRFRPRRLEAEAIRDGMLAASGTLDNRMFGEAVAEETRASGEIAPVGETAGGRRSIYLLVRRSMPVNFLNSFDAPVIETNCTRRQVSATPTQSLALLNSPFTSSTAHGMAKRLMAETSSLGEKFRAAGMVQRAWRLAYGRWPTNIELETSLSFLKKQVALSSSGRSATIKDQESAVADLCHAILAANEFHYID